MAVIERDGWSETDETAIREQLSRIVKSASFRQSQRRQRFLRHLLTETLGGRSERLTGYNLALEVFDRPETFDPATDPFVRIEAARLREKLHEYYRNEGRDDPVLIDLPKGAYVPQVSFRLDLPRQHVGSREVVPTTFPTVAVLPFDDLSAEQNIGYLGDGVAEDIITALSRFPDLAVVARHSSFVYKGRAIDMRRLGEKLGVDYAVEGSVRKDGAKLRIVAQLINTKNGEHVWAETFDKSGIDPWALQDDITGLIVSAIAGERGALRRGEYRQAWGKDATTSLEEYDYYLRGHEQIMKYSSEGVIASGVIWREGLSRFPGSLLLRIKLAWYHIVRAYLFVSDHPPRDFQKAGELARQVLSHDHLPLQVARLANWALSYVLVHEKDFEAALAMADKALALAPYDMFMRSRLMMVLVQSGEINEALRWAEQVAARDVGLGWSYNYAKGWAQLVDDQLENAAHAFNQTEFNDAHLLRAIIYVRLGQLDRAHTEIVKMLKIHPGMTVQKWRLGYSFRDPAVLDSCCVGLIQAGLPKL